MSLPNIPDITPKICICEEDVIKTLYMSIAMQEISLSHILNAEGEKLQQEIEISKCTCSSDSFIKMNSSVIDIMDKVIKIEELLIQKLKIITELL